MKLTNNDQAILIRWGYTRNDFSQIEHAMRNDTTIYTVDDVPIIRDEAIRRLGRETWLSGIARSAFHATCVRETEDGESVYFDSSKLFQSCR